MTVSHRLGIIKNHKYDNSGEIAANDLPLTEERLAVLGHEIRNPLCALSYAVEALASSKDDPQLAEDLLQTMRRQVSQLTRLCDDLLDTGRIARGKMLISRAMVNLGQVIRSACEEIRPIADECGHKMIVSLGDSTVMLLCDESRLMQVFANLLRNSAKFTAQNGCLHVSLEWEGDAAVVSFRDNGRGISADKLQDIFHANASMRCSKIACDGLGIGLRLAKAIIELHGGTIEAFSEGLGHGSTFVVRLPIISEPSADRTSVTSLLPMAILNNRLCLPNYRIVVVDDDRSIRFLMSRLLQNLNQSVTVVDNGTTAIEIIIESQPHVVFLDLHMSGISGYEVARQVRRRKDLSNVVLVALSGTADAASRKRAADAGFDRYLVKPTSSTVLAETLQYFGELSAC